MARSHKFGNPDQMWSIQAEEQGLRLSDIFCEDPDRADPEPMVSTSVVSSSWVLYASCRLALGRLLEACGTQGIALNNMDGSERLSHGKLHTLSVRVLLPIRQELLVAVRYSSGRHVYARVAVQPHALNAMYLELYENRMDEHAFFFIP